MRGSVALDFNTGNVPAEVEAVVLFGSRARGDWDQASDTDIGVFAAAEQLEDLAMVKDACALACGSGGVGVSLSVYSVRTAERLAAHGSLFLWHVRLEGAVLFRRSSWLEQVLCNDSLRPYDASCAWRDLETFQCVSREVQAALNQGHGTALFEAATLFAVLRGVGMIVGMRSGRPCFSRLEPIRQLQALMGAAFRLTDAEVSKLAEAKLVYSRRRSSSWHTPLSSIRKTAAKVNTLLEHSFDFVN